MIQIDRRKRITAEQALNHPLFGISEERATSYDEEAPNGLERAQDEKK